MNRVSRRIARRVTGDSACQSIGTLLSQDEKQPRFTLVFDHEDYSPAFFLEMQQRQIAVLTYHKFAGEDWPKDEFATCTVRLANGEESEMKLAEREVQLSRKLWLREVRKLTESGHQTSILTTNRVLDLEAVAGSMFARWNQENYCSRISPIGRER